MANDADIAAIDLFCGAGGLSYGLQRAGIQIAAGIDVDPDCEYPFEANIRAPFIRKDVCEVTAEELGELWGDAEYRLLAGCAPCQPFSPHRRGQDTSGEDQWSLLNEFSRLVGEAKPELVTMENVPRIGGAEVFKAFVSSLRDLGYSVDAKSRRCVDYGLAQGRRRLVLVASLFGEIELGAGPRSGRSPKTVRDVIGGLPAIESGVVDPGDTLHRARKLSPINIERIRASRPGGNWLDWPDALRAPCHQKASGASFKNMYARMAWDQPAPTITTLAHNYGAGRFGHPEQDRPISIREAAMLQGFPRRYKFVAPGEPVYFSSLGRLIGNAVPPPIGKAVGAALHRHIAERSAFNAAVG